MLLRRLSASRIGGLSDEAFRDLPLARTPNDIYCSGIKDISILRILGKNELVSRSNNSSGNDKQQSSNCLLIR